jgi:hypothetical protein
MRTSDNDENYCTARCDPPTGADRDDFAACEIDTRGFSLLTRAGRRGNMGKRKGLRLVPETLRRILALVPARRPTVYGDDGIPEAAYFSTREHCP